MLYIINAHTSIIVVCSMSYGLGASRSSSTNFVVVNFLSFTCYGTKKNYYNCYQQARSKYSSTGTNLYYLL